MTPEQVFTHEDPDDGTVSTYAVDRIIAVLKASAARPVTVYLDAPFAEFVIANRGIEAHRLERLRSLETAKMDPLIFAMQVDGTGLLIDGSHRFVVLVERGETIAPAYLLPPDLWKFFVVHSDGGIDKILAAPSGF